MSDNSTVGRGIWWASAVGNDPKRKAKRAVPLESLALTSTESAAPMALWMEDNEDEPPMSTTGSYYG